MLTVLIERDGIIQWAITGVPGNVQASTVLKMWLDWYGIAEAARSKYKATFVLNTTTFANVKPK